MEEKVLFCVKLADVPIGISAMYDTTKRFCREYLTEEPAAFSVEICSEDLQTERRKAAAELRGRLSQPGGTEAAKSPQPGGTEAAKSPQPGGDIPESDLRERLEAKVRRIPDGYLERLALYRKIAENLLACDVLLFHGSAIAVDGVGYLFTASSGTGKSTHTRLWRQAFGPRAVMINDDKPLLRITGSGVTVYGTPWDGKHHLSKNIGVPLKAVCILERSVGNHIEKIDQKAAWPMLMQQSYRPAGAANLRRTIALIDRLASGVELYRLGCNMEPEAAAVAYEGMR